MKSINIISRSVGVMMAVVFGATGICADEQHSKTEILSQQVICRQADRYLGWPSMVKTESGELIVAFSGDRDAHVCPWGKIQIIRSLDQGKTWTKAQTILNTPLDDRDPGLIQTRDGTLVLSSLTSMFFVGYKGHDLWARHIEKLTPEIRQQWTGYHMIRSSDNGESWSDPVKIPAFTPHGPIELTDGRLLYVGSQYHFNEVGNATCLANLVLESRDDGQSWQQIGEIQIAEGESQNNYHEPHVVETQPGYLLAMFRYEHVDPTQYFMRQATSSDGGKTWTRLEPTKIFGYPPHLLKLKDGRLLVAYGIRQKPDYGEYACLSTDGGKTWDVENRILIHNGPNSDLGYPASVQFDDGSIYTVYYQRVAEDDKMTVIYGTHWLLK